MIPFCEISLVFPNSGKSARPVSWEVVHMVKLLSLILYKSREAGVDIQVGQKPKSVDMQKPEILSWDKTPISPNGGNGRCTPIRVSRSERGWRLVTAGKPFRASELRGTARNWAMTDQRRIFAWLCLQYLWLDRNREFMRIQLDFHEGPCILWYPLLLTLGLRESWVLFGKDSPPSCRSSFSFFHRGPLREHIKPGATGHHYRDGMFAWKQTGE